MTKELYIKQKFEIAIEDSKEYTAATEIALFHLWLDLYPYDDGVNVR